MCRTEKHFSQSNERLAQKLWSTLSSDALQRLHELTIRYRLSIASGELLLIAGNWFVTHAGLLRIATRKQCAGIHTSPCEEFCDITGNRWVFRATVYKSARSKGFVGYGDADPSNVSPLLHGAEMRIAETRAINRALRKAYGIGICSVEEIGSLDRHAEPTPANEKKHPQPSTNGNGHGSRTVRDRLCQIIRQHELDPNLVKTHAADFCGVKTLRDASREQVENFVQHLANWAEKDRNALLCQLNSYMPGKEVWHEAALPRLAPSRSVSSERHP